jgi:hypothetical protein
MMMFLIFMIGLALGYVITTKVLNKKASEEGKNAYHAGFEAGIEKGKADLIAAAEAFQQKSDEELTKLLDKSEPLSYKISMETDEPKAKKSAPKKVAKKGKRKKR